MKGINLYCISFIMTYVVSLDARLGLTLHLSSIIAEVCWYFLCSSDNFTSAHNTVVALRPEVFQGIVFILSIGRVAKNINEYVT